MPDHLRQQIREDVVSALTGLTTTGSNVYDSRIYNLERARLPALAVFALSEASQVETIGMGTRRLARTVEIAVEGFAEGTTGLEDTLDTIAKESEVALATDPTRGGLAYDTRLASTEVELDGEGKKPAGRVRMVYEVDYRTVENDPTAAA